jgi:maltooligosyltrehalose trehalohydrolase
VHDEGARLRRWTWMIAESDLNDPRVVSPPALGGWGFDAAWNDDFHHAMHALLTGERAGYYADFGTLTQLAASLEGVYVHRGTWSEHRGRTHGRPVVGIDPTAFVGYSQTHDQIGNRAQGDRLTTLTTPARAEIAAALALLGPFTPMLFQGEEWGTLRPFPYFCDHVDDELAARVRDGRRQEFAAFGWAPEDVPDPQDPATFTCAVLDWDEPAKPEHAARLDWYRSLVAERRRAQAAATLRLGPVHVDAIAGTLVLDMGAYLVVVNLGAQDARVAVPGEEPLSMVLRNEEAVLVDEHEPRARAVGLSADTVAVLRRC